jgi:hypothetical protein
MKRYSLLLIFTCLLTLFGAPAYADQASLKIQPLQYREYLQTGEKKKGYIDVSNPTSSPLKVAVDVQAFRQVNNKAEVAFCDDEQIKQGIKTDYDTIDLAPKQALRMVFLVDGGKLPRGNVFAAIFFTTQNTDIFVSSQQVRLGTILSLVNKTPPSQHIAVTNMELAPVQMGDTVAGTMTIKNIGNPKKESGVYPKMTIKIDPVFASEYHYEAHLVFPGIARENTFSLPANRFGVYRLSVSDAKGVELASQWFVAMTGWTRLLIVATIFLGLGYVLHRHNQALRGVAQPTSHHVSVRHRKKRIVRKQKNK